MFATPDGLFLLGMTGFKTARYEMAERMIRRAIDGQWPAGPPSFPIWATRCCPRASSIEAAACFERALADSSRNTPRRCYNLGNTLSWPGIRLDKATAALQASAGRSSPDYCEAWCNLGAVYRQRQQRLDEAVNCFERALSHGAEQRRPVLQPGRRPSC
jgi:tetratricopeptide (TPR) repeat protein